MKHDPDSLDPLVERWGHVAPDMPQSVVPEVWRRIAHQESPVYEPGWWWKFQTAFARPAFAAAFIAACAVLGLFLAEVRLSQAQAQRSAQLQRAYLEMIDPLFQPSADAASRATNASHQP